MIVPPVIQLFPLHIQSYSDSMKFRGPHLLFHIMRVSYYLFFYCKCTILNLVDRVSTSLKVESKVLFLFYGVSLLSHKISYKQILFVHFLICFKDVRQTSKLTSYKVNSIIVSKPTDL